LGRAREFEQYLRGLLADRPDDADARIALARALAARGEAAEAIEELKRARERAPDNLEVRGALGRLLLAEGRGEEMAPEYGELIDALERQGLLREREKLT
ncbi:MAG TPA: tetratricopeptide repeat protein, partial [Myxococcota bacterium]